MKVNKMEMLRAVNSGLFAIRKYSPEILIIGGIVGAGVGTVMACMATTKLEEITAPVKETIDTIKEAEEVGSIPNKGNPDDMVDYTVEDAKKDRRITYAKASLKIVKLYGPAVFVWSLSAVAILSSHNILSKRNMALAAAYATLDTGFKEYRQRVIDRFGEDIEKEIRYNIKPKEHEETIINEKGKEKVVKKTTGVSDLAGISPYAFYFAPGNRNWDRNMGFNENFLRSEERYQNEMLKCYGHVFLNDVLKRLGIDELQSGQIVGWTYDPENPKIDSMIDFGIFQSTRAADNEDGFEVVFILDFNVDGDIWKKLPK